MHNNDLLKNAKYKKIYNGAVAGTSTITCTSFAMDGFNSCLVVADLATVVDACVLNLKVQDGAASNGSDAADITGAAAGLTASSSSNGVLAVNVHKPGARYLTVVLARGTQNATVNSIYVVLYNANGPLPVTVDSTVLASADVACAS